MNSGPTPPMGLARPSRSVNRYRLEVIQHPLRARCCGFGEKDRRPIDPPPVLQLFVEGEDGEYITVSSLDISFFLVQCDLYSDDGSEERNIVLHPSTVPNTHFTTNSSSNISPSISGGASVASESSKYGGSLSTVISLRNPTPTRNLMGSLIANAVQLENPQKTSGVYFIFPDLSVRSEGRYTLKFMFFDLAVGEPLTMSTKVQAEVYSQSFSVYSAKKFPGMTESTELSKCFARQGIKIPIRKESRFKRPTDRFYGANNSYSMNASPLKGGSTKASKIDEKFTSPDDEDENDTDDVPFTTTADISTAKNNDGLASRQAEPSASTSKERPEESPIPYKRLSISSYLSAQRD